MSCGAIHFAIIILWLWMTGIVSRTACTCEVVGRADCVMVVYPNLTSRCTAGVADTCSRWTGSQLQTIQHATNTLYYVHLVLCASDGWQASRSSIYVRECHATETRANRTYRTGIPPDSRPISLRTTRCAALHGGCSAHVFPGVWMSSPGAPVPVTASHTTGANCSWACAL